MYNRHNKDMLMSIIRRVNINILALNPFAERILTLGGGVELSIGKLFELLITDGQEFSDQVIKSISLSLGRGQGEGLSLRNKTNSIPQSLNHIEGRCKKC